MKLSFGGIDYEPEQIVAGTWCLTCGRGDGIVWLLPLQIFCVHCGQDYNVPASWSVVSADPPGKPGKPDA